MKQPLTVEDIIPIQQEIEEASTHLYKAVEKMAALKMNWGHIKNLIDAGACLTDISQELIRDAERQNLLRHEISGLNKMPYGGAVRQMTTLEFAEQLKRTPGRIVSDSDEVRFGRIPFTENQNSPQPEPAPDAES